MCIEDIKKDIIDIIAKEPKYYHNEIRAKYNGMLTELLPNKPIKEQIYVFLHGEQNCQICGNGNLYFQSIKDGYSKTCSKKCGYKLREQIFLKEHGVKNVAQIPATKENTRKTLEKIKKDDPDYTARRVEKIKATCIEKYGVDNYAKTAEYNTKSVKSSLEKYGTESPNQAESVKSLQKMTIQQKYGVDNISQSEDIKKKKEDTCFEHYGATHYAKTDIARNQFKINHNHHGQLEWSDDVRNVLLIKENLAARLEILTPVELAEELNVSFSTVYNYAIKHEIRSQYSDFSTEVIIKNILNKHDISFIQNDRTQIKPKELDFYIDDCKLAIEVCGLFWHSELQGKDKKYHLNKLKLCEEKGIRLITIFEDEIKDAIKLENKLKNILGKSEKLTGARNCEIKEITSAAAKDFFIKTHLQNHVNGKIYLGAFYENELVAAMSFGNLRKSLGSKNETAIYELLRYACVDSIPGIGSRLMSVFIREYKPVKIISYCDRRWSDGNFYKSLKFVFEKNTTPNYWYMKGHRNRQHRYSLTKQRLVALGGDASLTEWQIAQEMGYDRIWDCGSSKWVWRSSANCSK